MREDAPGLGPIAALAGSLPTFQRAGRVGIQILSFVRPPVAHGSRVSLLPFDAARADALPGLPAPVPLPRRALNDALLVLRPNGEFVSTDEVSLMRFERQRERWSLVLKLTRVDNEDSIPDIRDLFVCLWLDGGEQPLQGLNVQFAGYRRDSYGAETSLEPALEADFELDVAP